MKKHLSTQLHIFVGSRCAGRLRHMHRLIETAPHTYEPLVTVTSRTVRKEGDETWYQRMPHSEILKTYSIDEMLTYFDEGDAHYFVTIQNVIRVRARDKAPIVGMTPQGLERMMSRQSPKAIIPFTAIVLQPADRDGFCETLMRDHGLAPDVAAEETDRAVRLSTLPPPLSSVPPTPSRDSVVNKNRGWSIIPVPILGTFEDDARIDEALHSAVSP